MSFKKADVITFEDGHKVCVLNSIMYGDKEYLFVNEVLPDESDVTDKYDILYANYETGKITKVTDQDLIVKLSPLLEKDLMNI